MGKVRLALILFLAISATAFAQNPVPFVNQPLVPDAVAPGGPAFTLTVNGTGFVSGATVNWNGAPLTTTFVSQSQLTAAVPAANIATAGTATITVANPGTATVSNAVYFSIEIASPSVVFANAPGSPYSTGNSPYAIAEADFNGDGKIDLAVANIFSNNLTILLGNGDGTFSPALGSPIALGTRPIFVEVGDFNGDGNADLAVGLGGGAGVPLGGITILLGNGDGTFTQSPGSPVGLSFQPNSAAVGDFNGDGKLDIVVAGLPCSPNCTATTGDFVPLLGNGDGTFSVGTQYQLAVPDGSIAPGDFNGDGNLDLAVTGSYQAPSPGSQPEGLVEIFLGNGDGTFSTTGAVSLGQDDLPNFGLEVADFNKDGRLDLAFPETAGSASGSVSALIVNVLLGNGDGTFAPAPGPPVVSSLISGYSVAMGDFNNDGEPDVLLSGQGVPSFLALLGKGDGTFTPDPGSAISDLEEPAVVGDFDGNGMLDVAVVKDAGNVSVLLQVPAVRLSPSPVTFSNRIINTTSSAQTVQFVNQGSTVVNISAIAVSGDFAITTAGTTCATGTPVAAGGSCNINVTFTPTALGSRTGTLTITDDAYNSPQTAALSGTGINPAAVLAPTSLSFANQNVGTASAAQTVTLTNSGTGPLTIASIKASANYMETNTCATSVAQGANCSISVTFNPASGGTLAGTITVTDNAADSPQTVSLTGTGVPPTVTLSSTSLDFGSQPVSVASTAQTVTLTNNGPGPLLVTGVTPGGTNPGDFAETNNCLGTIPSSGTCTINVTFTPAAGGARSATISVADDAVLSPQVITASGNGVLPTVTQSATSLTFTGQDVGTTSAAQSVTITNTGTGPLTVSGVAITGANAADFIETDNCTPAVASGASCAVNVTFKPSTNGSETATLTVNDNAASGPQTVALSATGLAPVAALAPASVTFTGATVGTATAPMAVMLTNNGGQAMNLTSILASASFAETNDCPVGSTLAPSASCTISITFTAGAAGTTFGALIVSDNALSGSTQTVPLTGEATVTFAAQLAGTTSAAQKVMVRNTTASAYSVTGVAATGDFAASGACGTIAPGGNCSVSVTFTPTGGGTRAGNLVLRGTMPGGVAQVGLVGTGKDFTLGGLTSTQTVTPGTTASYQLQIGSQGGFAGAVALTCSGAPSNSTCTVTPSSVTLDGTNPQNVSLSVATTAPSAAIPVAPDPPAIPPAALWLVLLALAAMIAWAERSRFLAALGMTGGGRGMTKGARPCAPTETSKHKPQTAMAAVCATARRVTHILTPDFWPPASRSRLRPVTRHLSLVTALALLLFVALAASCGGGAAPATHTPTGGTAPGTYTLTVTATSGSLSHSSNVTLTVQ